MRRPPRANNHRKVLSDSVVSITGARDVEIACIATFHRLLGLLGRLGVVDVSVCRALLST